MFRCLVPPNVAVPVMDLTVNQSDTAVLRCSFQGNPPPSVTWTGPGSVEVMDGSNSATIEVLPGNNYTVESVLTISPAVRMDHEGEYTCTASNGVDNNVGFINSSSANLTVQGTYCILISIHTLLIPIKYVH